MKRAKLAIAAAVLTSVPVGAVAATQAPSDARDTTWGCPTCLVTGR